jgi:hypothetical protein
LEVRWTSKGKPADIDMAQILIAVIHIAKEIAGAAISDSADSLHPLHQK